MSILLRLDCSPGVAQQTASTADRAGSLHQPGIEGAKSAGVTIHSSKPLANRLNNPSNANRVFGHGSARYGGQSRLREEWS